MTRRPDPFLLALDSLKTRAQDGVLVPGAPVVISQEAPRLGISTTPVREALAWLSGHGLMERSPTGGYVAPRLEPAMVRDQQAFRLICLTVGLNGVGQVHGLGRAREPATTADGALREQMLRAVRGTGNSALVEAYARVSSQLARLRVAERRLFADLDEEAARLVTLFDQPPGSGLTEALAAYHHRRIAAAALLVMEADAARSASGDV